ncbi:MAG TPA: nucleotidyltransferase family protein [Alphaproteobacteria bacterium]|nr:nucleotidyltransferase family protein [Alphaproteobacteria bacterium]
MSLADRAPTPEMEILLLCARSRPEQRTDERLRALFAARIDWGRLTRMAWINRLIPLLHWHLLRLGAPMPEWVATHLAEAQARNEDRRRRLNERLQALVSALDKAGVPAITFKGPTLEVIAYAQPALRECADIDILVREADLPAVISTVQGAGYRLEERLGPVEERIFRGYHFAYEFVDPTGAANVDAHWRLLPSTWSVPIDYEGLWRRSGTSTVAGCTVNVLADEDLLFYLALHSTKERWLRLRMVCDVAELLRARPALDWDKALAAAAAQGGRRMLLLAAHLAATWLDAPVPDRVRVLAREDWLIRRFENQIWRMIESGEEDFSRVFELSWFRLLVLDRVRDRVGYVIRTLSTPRLVHTQIVRLPLPLAAGYVPLKLAYDYLVLPAWKVIHRLRARSGSMVARPDNGAR